MSSAGRGYGYGSYNSGDYDPRSNGYRNGSYNQDNSHGDRNPGLVPAYADTTSRRRSMNIEDILNPSDENTRRYEQSQSSASYQAGRTGSRNHGSSQGTRAPRSGPHSHGANASARSRGGPRPPKGPGSPDVPPRTRDFRPSYTEEQEHFIWYLRIDVRICQYQNPWPDLTLEPRGMSREVSPFRLSRLSSWVGNADFEMPIQCGYSWTDIVDAYNARFSQHGEGRRGIAGLECKFYRITKAHGLPNVRAMPRTPDTVQSCGMRAVTGYTREEYSWLDGRHPVSTDYGHVLGNASRR